MKRRPSGGRRASFTSRDRLAAQEGMRNNAVSHLGALELGIITLIVTMIFGVGKLPEVAGALGEGIRRFRRGVSDEEDEA